MKRYFTIILATAVAYLTLVPAAHAAMTWGTPTVDSHCVSEPAALLVSLTALGLFVAARRRKTA